MKSRAAAVFGSAIFLVAAPGVVAGLIPFVISGWKSARPVPAAATAAGALLVALGTAAVVESFARFAIRGRGTPAPVAPTEHLVVSGLYRYVRNPMYVAVVTAIAGQALLFGRGWLGVYAICVWSLFHCFVLLYEEPTLAARFGPSYATYRRHVRRWWPRVTPYRPPPE